MEVRPEKARRKAERKTGRLERRLKEGCKGLKEGWRGNSGMIARRKTGEG
jgi:hypothetical protein